MPGLTPSSPPPADDTRRGLVSTVAQTFAGAKTFLARIVATLGITSGANRLDLRSDLGAGASDVCSVVGSTVADASVNALAKLLSVRTGLGGTEIEKFFVRQDGAVVAVSAFGSIDLTPGGTPTINAVGLRRALFGSGASIWYAPGGTGATAVMHQFFPNFSLNDRAARVAQFFNDQNGINEVFSIFQLGTIKVGAGTIPLVSATGTPSATATQNAPKGRVTVPSAATSVTVTNDQVTADSFVGLEWEALPGVTHSVSCAAGSFTVTFSAALGSSLTFRYFVVR